VWFGGRSGTGGEVRDALLYCAECQTVHSVEALGAGSTRPRSSACRLWELDAMIATAADVITMAARSGLWSIAEEALDVVLGLNDGG
jgi:hypothetical protein